MTEIFAGIQILFAFIILPILIVLFVIIIGTTINFLPSYYIARYLSRFSHHFNRFIFVTTFVVCAIIIHLNVRIPGIIRDSIEKPTEYLNISDTINASIGDSISIEINDDNIQYKPKYLESTWLNTKDYCYGFEKATLVTDNFISRLKSKGLKIEHNTDAPIKIIGSIQKTPTHHEIKINVMKNKKIVAEYSNRFRVAFPGEQSDNAFLTLFFTVQQSTPTRLLFPDFWQGILKNRKPPVKYPVSKFLSEVFDISPQIETLKPVKLKISSSKIEIPESKIPEEQFRNNINDFCTLGNTRVDIAKRLIIDEKNLNSQKWAGYWVRIRKKDKPAILTYLQAPQGNIYRRASIHKTVCTKEHFYVLASFAGVGKSEEEWGALFEKRFGQKSTNTDEDKKFMNQEMLRLNIIRQRMVQKEFRKAWILKYSYDGSLKEAAVFTLPYDFPQHVDKLSQNSFGAWHFSGHNGEGKRVGGKWWYLISKRYDVLLEKDE